MAYPANLAVTNWGSLQSGNTADLDTNFRNLQVGLNGLGNGSSVLQSATITTTTIGNANIVSILATATNTSSIIANTATFISPLGISSGGTNSSTFANSAVVVITAGSMTGVLPAANGTALMSNGTAWGPATLPTSLNPSPLSNSLSSDVAIVNAGTFYDGPSIAQGSSGTWFATSHITFDNTSASSGNIDFKLWDGTTVIASGEISAVNGGNSYYSVTISGIITNPAGNIKFSATSSLSSSDIVMKANVTTLGQDCTLTAYRIS